MGREILFRAKRKDNGEWVEGYYIYCRKRHYILPVLNTTIGYDEREDEWIEIDPDTICQYTGLNDNTKWEKLTEAEKESFLSDWNYKKGRKNKVEDWNGRKIWENDICEMVYDGTMYVYVVVWDKSELDFKGTNGKENYKDNFEYLKCLDEITVIGDIFDNPELLNA